MNLLLRALANAQLRGITISCTIAKKPPGEVKESFARNKILLNVDVATRHAGLAVFDRRIIWYGSIPLLAFPQEEDCSIRFISAETAHELLEQNSTQSG